MQGTVKFFNKEKGFGFIKSLETWEDIFVHMSNIIPEWTVLQENQTVEYTEGEWRKGPQAENVRVI